MHILVALPGGLAIKIASEGNGLARKKLLDTGLVVDAEELRETLPDERRVFAGKDLAAEAKVKSVQPAPDIP